MRVAVLVCALLGMGFAGCINIASTSVEPVEAAPEPMSSVALTGEAGRDGPGWVFLYRAHDEPTEGYSFAASVNLRTEATSGPHSAAFFGPVPVALLGDGTLAPQLDFFIDRIDTSPSGESIEWSLGAWGGGSPSRNPIAGFAMIVAADAAFRVEYELSFAEDVGLNESASFDHVGNDTAFHFAGGLPGHLATFKTLPVDLEASGWSHFQILTGLGTTGPSMRATHVTFPSERQESHVDAYVPSYGMPPVSYAGVIRDTPGQFFAQSLIVEPHLDMELMLLHMPGVANALGYGWRTGSYHDGSPPVLSDERWHTWNDLEG